MKFFVMVFTNVSQNLGLVESRSFFPSWLSLDSNFNSVSDVFPIRLTNFGNRMTFNISYDLYVVT